MAGDGLEAQKLVPMVGPAVYTLTVRDPQLRDLFALLRALLEPITRARDRDQEQKGATEEKEAQQSREGQRRIMGEIWSASE